MVSKIWDKREIFKKGIFIFFVIFWWEILNIKYNWIGNDILDLKDIIVCFNFWNLFCFELWNVELRIVEIGFVKRLVFFFNNYVGILFGLCVFEGLSVDSFIKVENFDIIFMVWFLLLVCGGLKGLWVRGLKICIGVRNVELM